jgi:hypothetical protein
MMFLAKPPNFASERANSLCEHMNKHTVLRQADLLRKLRPVLESEGIVFKKKRHVLAKKAMTGQKIETRTGDGAETTNVAKKNDWIVQNETDAEEQYILTDKAFRERYVRIGPAKDGWEEFKPVSKILAVELTADRLRALRLPAFFQFKTAWKSEMVAKSEDFLAVPLDFSEIYRIARKEFFETYEPAK